MIASTLAIGGCEEKINVHGLLPKPGDVATIKPGIHKRSDVQVILGAPSTVANFDKSTWYYIGSRVKQVSFFEPELLERKVVAVQFNRQGIVQNIKTYDATKEKEITLVDRETPTKGKELTIIQQLIGNVGRFSVPEDDSGGIPNPGGGL